jgi:hypothetical protein
MNVSLPENEAERIYSALFNQKIPASVQEHFKVLSRKIESRYSEDDVNEYLDAVRKICDLEALEVASRHFKKLPVLSEKFKIMVYLAETLPENYSVFVNERSNYLLSFLFLMRALFRTGYKITKGIFILVVHRI